MIRSYSQMHRTDKYSENSSIIWRVWLNGWVFNYKLSRSGFESSCSHLKFGFRTCFQQGVSDTEATIECGFIVKDKRDIIRKYSQMHHTDRYSQHSSIIWPVWLNGRVFVYKLWGCGFQSSCCHLKFKFFSPVLIKEFLDIEATIECGFTLKRVLDMIRKYSQMHRTGK